MTYAELLARLLPARRFGMVFGLERTRALLHALGSPDERLGTVVHVGGTNGKGSTVAMIAALCRAAKLNVATYTSPHLSSLRERITFNGAPISEDALCAAADRVYAAGGDALTFFEQLTAIACVAIADANVDVTILEVGLGGRLDATNAVAAPIAVVTGVAMDHEAILGTTLDAIAGEKAGIFKRGQRIVVGASGEPAAVPLLVQRAREVGTAVTVVDDAAIAKITWLGLHGAHQRRNAAAALAAIGHLEALGVARFELIARGQTLASVKVPGRYEIVEDTPRIILDGAHNPHGARALADTLAERGERPVMILAVSADKDVRGIVSALAPRATAIICTRYQQERALDPQALAELAAEIVRGTSVSPLVEIEHDLQNDPTLDFDPVAAPTLADEIARAPTRDIDPAKLELARAPTRDIDPAKLDFARDDRPRRPSRPSVRVEVDVVAAPDLASADAIARELAVRARVSMLVAGSLFLVGEARVRYLGAPADPFVVTDPSAAR